MPHHISADRNRRRQIVSRPDTGTWSALLTLIPLALALALAGCSGDDQPSPDAGLSAPALAGGSLFADSGCTSCHGSYGVGGIGPQLRGLADSVVTLSDGSTVHADADYLRRSIKDPAAELVADYSVKMPENQLTEAEIGSIVTYLQAIK